MFKTIVVGTDGSAHGQHAVAVAAELARSLNARVVLVHAVEQVPLVLATAGGYVPFVPQSVIDENRAYAREQANGEFAAPLREAGVQYETRVAEGAPPIIIGQVAEEVGADLIVVGSRALHALGEFFLGSTSHALTHHTPVPVVVVPLGHSTPQPARTRDRVATGD